MKKLFSVLLAVLLAVLMLLPAVYAANNITPNVGEPVKLRVGESVRLIPQGNPVGQVHWDIDGIGNYCVVFRPDHLYQDSTAAPGNEHITTDSEPMWIVATDVIKKITITWRCDEETPALDPDDPPIITHKEGSIDIEIVAPIKEVIDSGGPFYILRIWWSDLKWTWMYEIHPTLKYEYFKFVKWFVNLLPAG